MKNVKSVILSILWFFSMYAHGQENESLWGVYSNVESINGEHSGFELFILPDNRPGKCHASVLIQLSEGSPQKPELLDCCGCTASKIEFVSTQLGRFNGAVLEGVLTGEFLESKYRLQLKKGLSVWQK